MDPDKTISAMSDSTLHLVYVHLRDNHPLSREETICGLNMSDWYCLVFEEVDRRGLPIYGDLS